MAYLIKGAHVYNPDDLGVQDVLVINDKIAAVGKDLTVVLPELETVDASDKILTPGFIDQHIHVTGGGGEGGPRSRTPEIVLSELISCGTTSLVGVSGTDSVTRSLPNLLAKVQALTEEGVTAWMYTSNYSYPPTTYEEHQSFRQSCRQHESESEGQEHSALSGKTNDGRLRQS